MAGRSPALDDVIYFAQLYPLMKKRIADDGRTGWFDEEYAKSNDPNTYVIAPQDAWRRLNPQYARTCIAPFDAFSSMA